MFNKFKFLINVLLYFISFNAIAASEKKEGMPQLDTTTYPSQIFWLVVTFGISYCILKFAITPKISEILNTRQERIDTDIFDAKSARESAEKSRLDQEKSLHQAKNDANAIVKEVIDKTKLELLESERTSKTKLKNKILDAERRIEKNKSESLNFVSEIATDITIEISKKLTGLKLTKEKADKVLSNNFSKINTFSAQKESK